MVVSRGNIFGIRESGRQFLEALYWERCSVRILIPMPIKIRPPRISIFFSKKWPILLPVKTPTNDNTKVTAPMTRMGVIIEIFRRAKLMPTAKASMLVAMERTNRVGKVSGLASFSLASILLDS